MTIVDTHVSGGIEIGGPAPVSFVSGSGQVDADVLVEWDFDNDGDFDQPVENITSYVMDSESMTGRDFPSQLTGKAGPGQLKLTLLNNDGRFSFFNQASPLNQAPFSLESGRKIRLRTVGSADPDPVLLARDRFGGTGTLVADELGNVWTDQTTPRFLRDGTGLAVHTGPSGPSGVTAISTVDVGQDSYYVQARLGKVPIGDGETRLGVVYRFVDSDDYSLFRIRSTLDGGTVGGNDVEGGFPAYFYELVDVTAGVVSTVASVQLPAADGVTIGVHVTADDEVSGFVNGARIPELVDPAAPNAGAEIVGILGTWIEHIAPQFDDFWVWDRATADTEGTLWTGDVVSVEPSVQLGPHNTVTVQAEGVLARPAIVEVDYPGEWEGNWTGVAVGRVLSDAGLLTPPGTIGRGSVQSGPLGLPRAAALDLMRRFEETELGFLYEAQEGWVNFEGRDDRAGRPVVAWFTDDDNQLGYSAVQLGDWRREIFNLVRAGVAPATPRAHWLYWYHSDDEHVQYQLNNGAEVDPGDLLLQIVTAHRGSSAERVNWLTPPGWEALTSGKAQSTTTQVAGNNFRVYARVADGTELGSVASPAVIATTEMLITADDISSTAALLIVRDWYGDIRQGIALGNEIDGSDPEPVAPPWAPSPSLFIAVRSGVSDSLAVGTDGWSGQGFDGYFLFDARTRNLFAPNGSTAQQIAMKVAAKAVEDPAAFDGNFSGFNRVATRAIAVRGYAGDAPESSGERTVERQDLESQERHNLVRSHVNASTLFADETDAAAYCEAVLTRHASPRPIITITFPATASAAYRAQAIRRRVGHKIHLTAHGDTRMGVDGDFFIEHINHRIRDGGKLWLCTWQLSPA